MLEIGDVPRLDLIEKATPNAINISPIKRINILLTGCVIFCFVSSITSPNFNMLICNKLMQFYKKKHIYYN